MSNRRALRELSRKFPAPPEVEKILNDLRTKDDYHAALIAVSIVEATLERLIVSRLRKTDKEFLNSLFENRGPLSDFNSRDSSCRSVWHRDRPTCSGTSFDACRTQCVRARENADIVDGAGSRNRG